MILPEIKGLKFPDIYVVRFFFKELADKKDLNVIEFGCCNGNNLMLFYQYGHNVTGIDRDHQIDNAVENFRQITREYPFKNSYLFYKADKLDLLKDHDQNISYDCLLFPSSLYYLDPISIRQVLELAFRKCVHPGSWIFFILRYPDDHRFGKGTDLGNNSFRLEIYETGEQNCIVTFFTPGDFKMLLSDLVILSDEHLLDHYYENIQNGKTIKNHDFVFYAKVQKVIC